MSVKGHLNENTFHTVIETMKHGYAIRSGLGLVSQSAGYDHGFTEIDFILFFFPQTPDKPGYKSPPAFPTPFLPENQKWAVFSKTASSKRQNWKSKIIQLESLGGLVMRFQSSLFDFSILEATRIVFVWVKIFKLL